MAPEKRPLKFPFSFAKALDALAFVANRWQGITPFYVAKVMFFADKWHLNEYGRPVTGDTYIAMPRGPVPSTIRDMVEEKFEFIEEPTNFRNMLRFEKRSYRHVYSNVSDSTLISLSESDKECLEAAIKHCRGKSLSDLSNETHRDKSWANAPANCPMNYVDFFDEANSDMLEEAREFAAYGVL